MSKLVDLVVAKQLIQHINGNNLDNPKQSAYKSGHWKTRFISRHHMASLLHLSY